MAPPRPPKTAKLPYNTLDKLVELHRRPEQDVFEFLQALFWYHLRATGERVADAHLIHEYCRASEVNPPTVEEIDRWLRASMMTAASEGYYRLAQTTVAHYNDRLGGSVFGTDLPIFKITKDRKGRLIWNPPAGRLPANIANWRGRLYQLYYFCNEHPVAGVISFMAGIMTITATPCFILLALLR